MARAHCGRIRIEIVAREGDRLEAFARCGRELQVVAVVAGYADVVDVEADTAVGVDPGLEIGGADRDVIDAGENRATPPGSSRAARIVLPSSSWPPPVESAPRIALQVLEVVAAVARARRILKQIEGWRARR
ncbi:MAG TPA: hypothetical protein VF871_03100 [Burkholderiales bacterium]